MKQRHRANIVQPTYPVWIVDYGNEVEKDLTEDWLRLIIGTDSGNDCVHVDAKTGESTMECIIPMQAIAVFPLVL